MDKVTSVFSFRQMGDQVLNPFIEKASFVTRTLEYKRNYFIVMDREEGIPTFAYYPVKIEVNGNVVRFQKFPGILSDGFLVLAKNQVVEIDIDEVSRGKFLLGDRATSFADFAAAIQASLPAVVQEEGILNILGEVDLLTYSVNPRSFWI